MDTQREQLANRGIDHDKYEVLLEHNRTTYVDTIVALVHELESE